MRTSSHYCARYQHALDVLSKRWTCLILTVLLEGPARFSTLAERLEVVGDRMLSERLKDLEAAGIVERRAFLDSPGRVEYVLTEKGRALEAVLGAIRTWSGTWVEA